MSWKSYFTILLVLSECIAYAQVRVGINTPEPSRTLEVSGSGAQYIRVRTDAIGASRAGMELIRGGNNFGVRDWRLLNAGGLFRISTSLNNFGSGDDYKMTVNTLGQVGIGTSPTSKLHVDGGEEASLTGNGYMMLGNHTFNMVFDPNEIIARNLGSNTILWIQNYGGHTNIGFGGGNVYTGDVAVGIGNAAAPLSINDNEYQMYLRNSHGDINDWYVGVSEPGWAVGEDQLIFSPTSFSGDAQLRLLDVVDNDGVEAPFMIHTSANHVLLMDGNEIDAKSAALHINHNSQQNTFINPSGGKVGIGTSNPQGTLHVRSTDNWEPFGMDHVDAPSNTFPWRWTVADNASEDFNMRWGEIYVVSVNGNTGQYSSISDRRLKKNIQPMLPVLDRVMQIGTYNYQMINDPRAREDIGVIAQELKEIIPTAVLAQNDQYGVSYGQLSVFALKALQEQQSIIRELKDKISRLQAIREDIALGKHDDMRLRANSEENESPDHN